MDDKATQLIARIGTMVGLFLAGFLIGDLAGFSISGMTALWGLIDYVLKTYLPALAPVIVMVAIYMVLNSRSEEQIRQQQRRTKADLLAVLFEMETATGYLKSEFRKLDDLITEKRPQSTQRVRSIVTPIPYTMPTSDMRDSLAELPTAATGVILQAYHALKAHDDIPAGLNTTRDLEVNDLITTARRVAFTGSRVAAAALRLSKMLPVSETMRRSLAATAAMFKDSEDQMADVDERPARARASATPPPSARASAEAADDDGDKPKGSARAAEIRAALNKKKSFRPTPGKGAEEAS